MLAFISSGSGPRSIKGAASYKYSNYSTSERNISDLRLHSADNGKVGPLDLGLFFIPLHRKEQHRK